MTDKTDTPQPTEEVVMAKYGITRERTDYYHLDSFRYTSLKDAVAQAKRIANTGSV